MATRVAGGRVMNDIAPRLPALFGGSANLDPSTHTALRGQGTFNPPWASMATRWALRPSARQRLRAG
jgi:transketolase